MEGVCTARGETDVFVHPDIIHKQKSLSGECSHIVIHRLSDPDSGNSM